MSSLINRLASKKAHRPLDPVILTDQKNNEEDQKGNREYRELKLLKLDTENYFIPFFLVCTALSFLAAWPVQSFADRNILNEFCNSAGQLALPKHLTPKKPNAGDLAHKRKLEAACLAQARAAWP